MAGFRTWLFGLVVIACTVAGSAARAAVTAEISISEQRMRVYDEQGTLLYAWPVSTGRRGHATPRGAFSALGFERMHYSRKYDNAPMPHSVFFTNKGHAIHAATGRGIGTLGQRASHGCVRLPPAAARAFFRLAHSTGARIIIR